MPTAKQTLGNFGEYAVSKHCSCPKCKRSSTLKRLPSNFKCADIICDFCGYLAQVKTSSSKNINDIPRKIPGAAWQPHLDRMEAGIYLPLFLVLVEPSSSFAIYYLAADLQKQDMYLVRKPLSTSARRAGWQGFYYDFSICEGAMVKLYEESRSSHLNSMPASSTKCTLVPAK